MKLCVLVALGVAANTPALATNQCSDYGGDGIVCAAGQCYECHDRHCSTDGPGPTAPNCGDDIAEPKLSTPCGDDAASLHACAVAAAAACNDNTECHSFSLDPAWGTTTAKLWKNNGSGLVANNDWNTWVPTNKTAPPAPAPAPPGSCRSDLDCSLNGECVADGSLGVPVKKCVCDKPWVGTACDTLSFKPVTFPQVYVFDEKQVLT